MTITSLARPEIQALTAYEAAAQVADTIRLNANEAPWTSPADHFRRPLNRYPEIRPAALRSALATRYGCDAARLLVTRGTSEAIDLLVRAFCRAGLDNIVTSSPSFSMYRHYAAVQGAQCREVGTDPDKDFAIDVDALLDACDGDTRLVFVCSPNNPTGTLLPRSDLCELLERRGDSSAIVVDEAYVEFADTPSAVELLDRYPNLVVLRTLSKALAFAGARCGSVIGPPDLIRMLSAVQAPYALATPVVECVQDALQTESLDEAERWRETIISERKRLVAELGKLDFVHRTWPSAANFFLVEVEDASAILEYASANKVLLRHFGGQLANCLRITVGAPGENDRLLDLLRKMGN
ncbi:MAG TPA: histidinol-phosphate transaminase [Woeseiaceae bacterium]|jgi:histidinol-phosphate aminotransferase|nr:histidinol-phosphate transaminase [Woeseiaceae bacterium]